MHTREVGPDPKTHHGLQPFLHDALVVLHAPTLVVSRPDGQLHGGIDGFYHGDLRALSALRIELDQVVTVPVRHELRGADVALFRAVLRGVGQHTADPAVTLARTRQVHPGRFDERLVLHNAGNAEVLLQLVVTARVDLAPIDVVRRGEAGAAVPAAAEPSGLRWQGDRLSTRLSAEPVPSEVDSARGELRFPVRLAPGGSWTGTLTVLAEDVEPPLFAAVCDEQVPWPDVVLRSADPVFTTLVDRSLTDLRRLLLAEVGQPRDLFLAAGAPWFLTLFGRDSLWAARMLLPLGTELAAGTLRTLARRQGQVVDRRTEEEPGKIPHEIRRGELRLDSTITLPPCYYGTIDATALWVILLHDAWRWGMPPQEVEALLDNAEAALCWLADYGDADGDGLLEYVDRTGHGLANQGWKDSGDSIRWRDGRLAPPPIALCEVQAYAHQAAQHGATLLRAFGRGGADRWDEWAAALRTRFRAVFWVADEQAPYPAIALDADKRPVDAVSSNLGHLLGTGLLDEAESELVARRLAGHDMDSGFGLRTLSTNSVGFNPLGYHVGSVWPHDTAIAVDGLLRAGFTEVAASLTGGLVAAAAAFDGQLPELFAGDDRAEVSRPAPYPAACRPQAWSAAGSVLLLRAILGLDADVPGGTLRLDPMAGLGQFPLSVSGLRAGGEPLTVRVDADGTTKISGPAGLSWLA